MKVFAFPALPPRVHLFLLPLVLLVPPSMAQPVDSADVMASSESHSTTEPVNLPARYEDLKPSRPRLMLDRERLNLWQSGFPLGSHLAERAEEYLTRARIALNTSPAQYPGHGKDVLEAARQVMRSSLALSFAYLHTGEEHFRHRLWQELETAGNFPNWGEEVQFLATAEMMFGFSVAYDWLHQSWSPAQRQFIEQTIHDKGLLPAQRAYAFTLPGYHGWNDVNNWNFVCNGSIAIAAIAVMEQFPEISSQLLDQALELLPKAIRQFRTDGGWVEGTTYWQYGGTYLVRLLSSLETAFGTDFGLSSITPGLALTGYFPIYLTSPIGQAFDFGDAHPGRFSPPPLAYFATAYANSTWASFRSSSPGVGIEDLLFLSPEAPGSWSHLPLDRSFPDVGVVTLRSSWTDPNALWLAAKGGKNGGAHSHLDLGSFLFDAWGERWFVDLNKESYSRSGYFHIRPEGLRWRYYRSRAEGHNTLVIGRSPLPDQLTDAEAPILHFASGPAEAFTVFDLSQAYARNATSVHRGFALSQGRSLLVIRDEISTTDPQPITWSVHHPHLVRLSSNRRVAVLQTRDKALRLEIHSPSDATFADEAAAPIVRQETSLQNTPVTGIRALRIHLTPRQQTDLTVSIRPTAPNSPGLEVADFFLQTKLEDWEVRSEAPSLESVHLDGEELLSSHPAARSATANLNRRVRHHQFVATFTDPQRSPLSLELPADLNLHQVPLSEIESPWDPTYQTLFIEPKILPPLLLETFADRREAMKASSERFDQTHIPEHVLDGRLGTRWSAEGAGSRLLIELDRVRTIHGLGLAFHQGNARKSSFALESSSDGVSWQLVLPPTESSGQTLRVEIFPFSQPVSARFFRYTGFGNSVNAWNSVTEFVPLEQLPPEALENP
ncbi:MAG: heparinase II/III family protein [Puniceicoccaceae bacterium]